MTAQDAKLKDWPDLEGLAVGNYIVADDGIKGGQGRYYRVKKKDDGRIYGCKILHAVYAASEDSLERFKKEGGLLIEFDHPNIVKGYEVGRQNGLHYIIMKHLQGRTLTDHLRAHGTLPPRQVYAVMKGIAEVLVFFHDKGYIHRDIKPSNIILTDDGAPYIIDLGTFWDEIEPNPKEKELIMGTVQYMSPEQIAGNNNRIDHRSDCYSFGMTLLHLMSGRPPFPDRDPKVVLTKQVTQKPVIGPEIADSFCADSIFILRKMIEKHPNLRYQSPRELLQDIENMDMDLELTDADMETTVVRRGSSFFDFDTEALQIEKEVRPSDVSQAVLRALEKRKAASISLDVGEVLFYEGDLDDDVFILRGGEIEVLQGGKLLFECREPGALFGEMAALLGEPRSATIRARSSTLMSMMSKNSYLEMLIANPELAVTTARVIGERLSNTNIKLVEALSKLGMLEKQLLRLFARKKVEAFSVEQVEALRERLLGIVNEEKS